MPIHGGPSVFLSALLTTCACSASCWAVVETWQLVPSQSVLTLTGTIDNGDLTISPQSPGASVAKYTGQITADRTFDGPSLSTLLQFTGGSVIDAQANPAGPFDPAGLNTQGTEHNYGVEVVSTTGGEFTGNIRDLVFDIVGGTATVGEAAGLSFDVTSGVLNEGNDMGATFQRMDTLDFATNQSSAPITIVQGGGYETLTLPVQLNYTIPLQISDAFALVSYTGQLVARRGTPGDSSGDGTVDNMDFIDFQNSFGSSSNLNADFNQDGVISVPDYTLWRDQLTQSAASTQSPQAVPEPRSAILLGMAIGIGITSYLAICTRQRGRQQN